MASKKISLFIPLFAMMLPLAGCGASSQFVPQSEAEAQGYTRIDFEWTSNDKTEGQDYFYYTDDFFKKPASESDMAFAHASYAWALANFPSDPKELTDYSNKSRYARKLSEKLGFTDFVCNNWYKIKPTNGSIGITCSKKAIDLGDGTSTTVILVGIRGAAYEAEWASNVTLGEEGDATGFGDAAAEVSMFVSDYVTDHSISGPIKVWVSGYSRAAATTNLFAGHLDETALDGISAFSEGVTYKKDDIYAFCFEPPAGADAEKGDLHSEDFNNIKCYINPDDLVPYVAPKYFGFTRYGEQLFYPSPLKTLKYREYENKMLSLLNPYIRNGHPNYKAYSIPQFKPLSGGGENKKAVFGVDERKINWTLELQMGAFIENLASNGLYDRFPYTNTVQPGLARAITMVFDHAAGETAPFVKAIQAMIPELLNLNLSSALIDDLMIDELRPYFGTDFIP
ncbi:MAG: hypothetical protein K6F32_00430, partial [Bacilli bacterium]|nr:hypothetical protein [Bacilli bacterium]